MKKKLSIIDLAQLSEMVAAGKTNTEIASHFGVSVATINNHKVRLKREVKQLPSKRGRKPKLSTDNANQRKENNIKSTDFNFIVNGVGITISKLAKNVVINKDSIEIRF